MSRADYKKILDLLKLAYVENGDAHVTPADVERFLDSNITMRYVKKHNPIVNVGSHITAVNLVLTGSFSIIRRGHTGRSLSISKVNCPEIIGSTQIFSNVREFYSDFIATEDCCCIDIDYKLFHEATWQENKISMILISHLCRVIQGSHSRIDRIVNHNSTDNLVIFLYHRWLERGSPSNKFKVSDAYSLIAMEIGVSPRTLYRSINKLRDSGIIDVGKGDGITMNSEQLGLICEYYAKLMLPQEQTLNVSLDIDRFNSEEFKTRL